MCYLLIFINDRFGTRIKCCIGSILSLYDAIAMHCNVKLKLPTKINPI